MPSSRPLKASIDADGMLYVTAYKERENTVSEARTALATWVKNIMIETETQSCKIHIGGGGNFRYDVAVTHKYKGNRDDFVRPEYYAPLRKFIIEELGAIENHGQEADDAVAQDSTADSFWICHVDKDLDQLPGWHHNNNTGVQYYVSPFQGLWSFYKQLLMGDTTDNIYCLKGVGPKTAQKILEGSTNIVDLHTRCTKAYEDYHEPYERLLENAHLLWLRRRVGEVWRPPI